MDIEKMKERIRKMPLETLEELEESIESRKEVIRLREIKVSTPVCYSFPPRHAMSKYNGKVAFVQKIVGNRAFVKIGDRKYEIQKDRLKKIEETEDE